MNVKKFEEKEYILGLLCENKKLTMCLYHDHKTYRESITARTSLAADLPKKKTYSAGVGGVQFVYGSTIAKVRRGL
jgi:hypothetical protein